MEELKREKKRSDGANGLAYGYPVIAFISMILFFAVFLLLKLEQAIGSEAQGILYRLACSNYLTYFASLVAFVLGFLALRALSARGAWRRAKHGLWTDLEKRGRLTVFAVFTVLLLTFLALYLFVTEVDGSVFGSGDFDLLWRALPFPLVFVVLFALVAFQVYHMYKGESMPFSLVPVAYVTVIMLAFYCTLYYQVPDYYHGAAYTESITNTVNGVPFNIYTTGVYGHYALFFAPLIKLFGGSTIAMLRLIALSGAVAAALCVYIIHNVVSRNNIRILAAFTCVVTLVAFRENNYWQLQPGRILFGLAVVAYIVHLCKRGRFDRTGVLIGFGLCAAAILWNTESGMFSLAAYVLALVVRFWQKERWNSREMLLHYAEWVACAALSVLAAIFALNIYNLFCGGSFIFLDFFFPLLTPSYMTGEIAISVGGGFHIWYLTLVMFFVLIFHGIYHTRFVRPDADDHHPHAPVYVALGVVALLSISYYINRAAYMNLDICIQFASVAIGIFADRFAGEWLTLLHEKKTFMRAMSGAFSLVALIVLVVVSAQNLAFGDAYRLRIREGFWDKDTFLAQCEEFEEILPDEDYIVIGCGANLFMMQNGRESVCHYRDFSDLTVGHEQADVKEKVFIDAYDHGRIAIYEFEHHAKDLSRRIAATGHFREVSRGKVNGITLVCYERIK